MEELIGTAENVLKNCLAFFLALLQISSSFTVEVLDAALASCYKLSAQSCKVAANSIKGALAWLKYKARCASSGEFMEPWLKQLKDALHKADETSEQLKDTPRRRLTKKTSLTDDSTQDAPAISSSRTSNAFMTALHSVGGSAFFASSVPCSRKRQAEDVVSVASTVPVEDLEDIPIVLSSREIEAQRRAEQKTVQYWDASAQTMARLHQGETVLAQMQPGADGFLQALWPDGSRTNTEHPNLCLQQSTSHSAEVVLRRPAAAIKRPAYAIVAQDVLQSVPGYTVMRYPTGAVALRETTGKKRQLWQISDKQKSTEELKQICLKAAQQLASGDMTQEESKAWAQTQL